MRKVLKNKQVVSFGCRVDPRDVRDYAYAPGPRALPVVIDNGGQVAHIMNQNPEGACTGHAVCAAAEFHYWRRTGQRVDLSQRWAYRKARENDPWPGENYHGSSTRAAVKAWVKFGICDEKYWPWEAYQISDESPEFNLPAWEGAPKEGAQENALKYPVQTYMRCRNMYEIKHAIHEFGLAIVGATVHSGWDIWGNEDIKFDDSVYQLGGHAFILVGYDEEKQVFYVVNSWGEEWGKKGIANYGYADANTNIHDAWTVAVPLKVGA